MSGSREDYDVIILGAGIAGSIMGAILARNGTRVLLADAGVHPRFAVGESLVPRTLSLFRIMADRYGVPELGVLSSFDATVKHIGPSMGRKLHFGFMMHEDGKEPDPERTTQFGTAIAGTDTSHLFRQDTDSFLFHTAVSYGCIAKQGYRVDDIELTDSGVTVVGHDGSRQTARYLIDGSGFRSPVAGKYGLRAGPDAVKHHSRSMFTHMIDVPPTDVCLKMPDSAHPPMPWVMGTMHHIFERGWFWIIPFNNDPASVNPLVSVGLTFDERRYPKQSGLSPERIRPWVSTDRLQYTSTKTIGARWCLMSHAAGFIDPLYSRGLTNTVEVINALAWRLIEALKDDDFSDERFEYVEQLQKGLIRYNDSLVNSSFISWSDWNLWNAVYRVWAASIVPANLHLDRAFEHFQIDRDDRVYRNLETEDPYPGAPFPSKSYDELFSEMVRLCDAVDHGDMESENAGRQLMNMVTSSPGVLPVQGLKDPASRFIAQTRESNLALARWMADQGPEEMRYLIDNPRIKELLKRRA
jgi:FADH2 O2-dependent halogenase